MLLLSRAKLPHYVFYVTGIHKKDIWRWIWIMDEGVSPANSKQQLASV
jgi:hypothetical protein